MSRVNFPALSAGFMLLSGCTFLDVRTYSWDATGDKLFANVVGHCFALKRNGQVMRNDSDAWLVVDNENDKDPFDSKAPFFIAKGTQFRVTQVIRTRHPQVGTFGGIYSAIDGLTVDVSRVFAQQYGNHPFEPLAVERCD